MRNFIEIECINCGILFGMSETFNLNLRKSKANFHCPNGHGMSYIKSTEEFQAEHLDQKRKEIFRLETEIQRLERQLKSKSRKNGKSKSSN